MFHVDYYGPFQHLFATRSFHQRSQVMLENSEDSLQVVILFN